MTARHGMPGLRRVLLIAAACVAACVRAEPDLSPAVEPELTPAPDARLEATIESLGERIMAQQAQLDSLARERDSLRAELRALKDIDLRRQKPRGKRP
jgi:hypothetical protein